MKWTKAAKVKLYHELADKLECIINLYNHLDYAEMCPAVEKQWEDLLSSFDIEKVSVNPATVPSLLYGKGDGPQFRSVPEFCYIVGNYLVLDDPWGGGNEIGLKIKKEIAEKFLILGVP